MSVLLVKASATAIPLPDDAVQCVVTSPPYWGLRKYAGEQEVCWKGWRAGGWSGAYGLEPNFKMYIEHTVEILREIRRVLRPDGVCFWNIGDSYAGGGPHHGEKNLGKSGTNRGSITGIDRTHVPGLKPKNLCLIPQRVAIAAQEDGWWVRSVITWAKSNPMPESCKDRPTDAYEHILMLTKSERYFWDADAAQEPALVGYRSTSFMPTSAKDRQSPSPTAATAASMNNRTEEFISSRNMRNVWTFPPQPYSGAHFATFPEELPRRCIRAATRPGDLVLDPFAGSGTTGYVAKEYGRRAVLLDLAYDSTYRDLAVERTTDVQQVLELCAG
jgi:DNA modification methylase